MWETNKRKPDLDMIVRLADYFNVSTDYILYRTDEDNMFSTYHSAFSEPEQKVLDAFGQLNSDNLNQ